MFKPLSLPVRLGLAAVLVALIAVPLVVTSTYLLHLFILSLLFGLFASSWNLASGYAGLKSFGHHAFFGVGAYVSALVSKTFSISPWLTLWLGGASAAFCGLLLALPVLRIRSMPHVAIVTLGFAEITRIVIGNLRDYTRGELGLWGIPSFDSLTLPYFGEVIFNAAEKVPYYYLMLALFVAGELALALYMRSARGLAVLAIRDAQDAAESLGVNLTRQKVEVFVIGATLAGLCGAFYAHYILVLTPNAVIGLDMMVLVLAMTLVGGLGTFFGPILGAFALTMLGEGLRGFGDYRMLIYGIGIVVVTLVLPKGLSSLTGTAFRVHFLNRFKGRTA